MIVRISHIAIYVENVEVSLRFYRDLLGFKEIARPGFSFPGAWLEIAGEQQLHIIGMRQEDKERFYDKSLSKPRGNHFAVQVSSYVEVEQMLKEKGVDYLPPKTRPDGAIQIFINDPDGYWIEFVEIKIS